ERERGFSRRNRAADSALLQWPAGRVHGRFLLDSPDHMIETGHPEVRIVEEIAGVAGVDEPFEILEVLRLEMGRSTLAEVGQVVDQERALQRVEWCLPIACPCAPRNGSQPCRPEELAELPGDVVLPGRSRLLEEAAPLREADGQLDIDRPGEQDLVERVVLED